MNGLCNAAPQFAPALPLNHVDEFASMSISDLASVLDVWAQLSDRMTEESQRPSIPGACLGEYYEDYANVFGIKADIALAALKERSPQSNTERQIKAWAIIKWAGGMSFCRDDVRRALADLTAGDA